MYIGDTWKLHRKLLNPTVQNYNILNSFYPTFNKNAKQLLALLHAHVEKKSIDMYFFLEACTFDTVCGIIISGPVNYRIIRIFYIFFLNSQKRHLEPKSMFINLKNIYHSLNPLIRKCFIGQYLNFNLSYSKY